MKKNMKKWLSLSLALLLVFGLAACGGGSGGGGGAASGDGPIVIGTIQDLTGGASIAGIPNARGVVYAVEALNAEGGINGREIELHVLDATDPNEGIDAYRRLVEEIGVHAIVGPPLSNIALAWVELSAEDEIPVVGHFMDEAATTNPDTGEPFPYMFLAQPSSMIHAGAMADFAINELGFTTFATIYNSANAFAVSQAEPFIRYVEANGGQVLVEETFSWTDTDVSAQAIRVVQANPEAVYISDFAVQARMIVEQLRQAGFTGYILGANTLGANFATLMPGEDLSQVFFISNYDETDFTTKTGELVRRYQEEEGVDFWVGNVGFGWDATMVLAHALRLADDPTNGAEVRDILANQTTNVQGSTSLITIDPATHRPTGMPLFIGRHLPGGGGGIEIITSVTVYERDVR